MGRESVARPAVRHLCWTSLPVPSLAAESVSVDPFGIFIPLAALWGACRARQPRSPSTASASSGR